MLDRRVVKEFLDGELREAEIPKALSSEAILETFCEYVEDDYYEWLKDNFKSFFNHGNPDWRWIEKRIEQHSKQ